MSRRDELEKRLVTVTRNNGSYRRAFGDRIEILSGEKHVANYSLEIKNWDRTNLDNFEQKILKLEKAEKELSEIRKKEYPIFLKKMEYSKIDHLFLEGLAEREEGRPEKLKEYFKLRAKIKNDNPKV